MYIRTPYTSYNRAAGCAVARARSRPIAASIVRTQFSSALPCPHTVRHKSKRMQNKLRSPTTTSTTTRWPGSSLSFSSVRVRRTHTQTHTHTLGDENRRARVRAPQPNINIIMCDERPQQQQPQPQQQQPFRWQREQRSQQSQPPPRPRSLPAHGVLIRIESDKIQVIRAAAMRTGRTRAATAARAPIYI